MAQWPDKAGSWRRARSEVQEQELNRPRSRLGIFSLGPATKTTVVTTTTTTTTTFPPFRIPAPTRVFDADNKIYPLATSQTPASLQDIAFPLQGQNAVFSEAMQTSSAQNGQQRDIQSNPVLRSHNSPSSARHGKQKSQPTVSGLQTAAADQGSATTFVPSRSRPTTKIRPRSVGKKALSVEGLEYSTAHLPSARETSVLRPHKMSSITPDTQSQLEHFTTKSTPLSRQGLSHTNRNTMPLPLPKDSPPNTLTQRPHSRRLGLSIETTPVRQTRPGSRNPSRASFDSAVPTPPIEPDESHNLSFGPSPHTLSSVPARLQRSLSPSLPDGTLPSPSLSPSTVAEDTSQGYFDDAISQAEGWDLDTQNTPSSSSTESSPHLVRPEDTDGEEYASAQPYTTARDIPAILDFFETLPDGMKSYVIHQLLRRCPKSTLHMVADAVNPVLKCDFLALLPAELRPNILQHLDLLSMCHAAQVSKKWRQIVNGAESTWKRMLERDGYKVPAGELESAISQGWGWQDPTGSHGREINMSKPMSVKSESDGDEPEQTTIQKAADFILRRSKRKASTQSPSAKRPAKRQATSRSRSSHTGPVDWMALMSTAEGPYNAANAAILAVPEPDLPVPSLKGLHLYKSLYRRHHQIKKNWMAEDLRPQHIAFRAHDSHVVTCLQFDTDKILTGSDDNNINVYDTKTGALRRVLRGHEGGVWALEYMGNTLISGSTDRSVRIWNIETGEQTHAFRGHTSTVRCLQILLPTKVGVTRKGEDIMEPKEALIITGSRDSTLRVWKLPKPTDPRHIHTEQDAETVESPYFVRKFEGHSHSVRAIAAHADTIVSGSYDATVRVWKISTGETVHRLNGHTAKVYSVVLDVPRKRCISGSMDYSVKIWSLETGCALYTLEGHSSLVGLLDLQDDRLVSAAADSTLRIWDPENGRCNHTLAAHTNAITCFQHDDQKVISGSDRTLKLWDINTGYFKKDLLDDLNGVWQVRFNDRRCVAAVQRDSVTFIEVLDFGAPRDGVSETDLGRRIVVDVDGNEVREQLGDENIPPITLD